MSEAADPLVPAPSGGRADPDQVFFIGDSITLGWRDEEIGGWPVRLLAGLNPAHSVTAYNLGVRSDTSERILARWRDEVSRRRPTKRALLVFAFGANDAKLQNGAPLMSLTEVAGNARRILSAAVAEYRVLLVGPAPVHEGALARTINPAGDVPVPTNHQIAAVSAVLATEAAALGVPFLDLMARLGEQASWYDALCETDGIHPPARGYDAIATAIATWQPWADLFRPDTR